MELLPETNIMAMFVDQCSKTQTSQGPESSRKDAMAKALKGRSWLRRPWKSSIP